MALLKIKREWLSLPKSDPKVKTILHIHAPPLCHIQRQRLEKTQHWYHMIMLGFWDWILKHSEKTQTENMDIIKHLEKYDSSNHHFGHLRKRAQWGWGAALRSTDYKMKLYFPAPVIKGPEGRDGFHLVFSPSIRDKLKTVFPPCFDQFNIESVLT